MEPTGGTPLYDGMSRFTEPGYAPAFQSLDLESYLLIVSDGADTCGIGAGQMTPVTPEALTELTSKILNDHGIKTFVIGFGGNSYPIELNAIAAAGGTSFTQYIDALNQQELELALDAIARLAIGCEYEIAEQDGVDFNRVRFYFDGTELGWDPQCMFGKGWTWLDSEHTRVLFCDASCDMLKTGAIDLISATFGCPPHPIE